MATRRQARRKESSRSVGIGPKLRWLREAKGVGVRALARDVGVSASLISSIEHGRTMPSVDTLAAIADVLDLDVGAFFTDLETDTAPELERDEYRRRGLDPVLRPKGRKVIRLAGDVRWERLTPTHDRDVEFLHVTYEVGAASCPEDGLVRHGGMEYAYMISGRLGVTIGFETFELGPGDSVTWDAQVPHRLWTIGDEPAVAVWVVLNRAGDARADTPN